MTLNIDFTVTIPPIVKNNNPNFALISDVDLVNGSFYHVKSDKVSISIMRNGRIYGYLNCYNDNVYVFKLDPAYDVSCVYCEKKHGSNDMCKHYYYIDNYVEFQSKVVEKKFVAKRTLHAQHSLVWGAGHTILYPKLSGYSVGDQFVIAFDKKSYKVVYSKSIISRLCDTPFGSYEGIIVNRGMLIIMECKLQVDH
jgi:hypothetical protein